VEDKSNRDECMQMFWRMYNCNGQLNSLATCGISYDDFKNGFFFAVYDLSTSGKCATNFVIPAIRVGHLRMRVQFSDTMPIDLTMILHCESPSTLYIGKGGKTTASYAPI
jgi:hypothetical protein